MLIIANFRMGKLTHVVNLTWENAHPIGIFYANEFTW